MKQSLTAILLLFAFMAANAHEVTPAEREHYTDTDNCVRIFDWDTLELLMNTKIPKVNINAKSGEELLSQLKKSLEGIDEFKDLRIDFKRELFERPVTDNMLGEGITLGGDNGKIIPADVELKLVNVPLLIVIRFVSDQMKMTFSVKKGEILFRPLIG